jgi:PAS domain S-box-containing protein
MSKKPTCEELEKKLRALKVENDEIRKAKMAVETSEALHRLTLENISDTVIVTDDHGKIIYACPNTEMIFGLTQNQVYQRGTIQELIGGNACELSELGNVQAISNIEWTVLDPSGQERYVLITVKLVSINRGTVLYAMRDITERKKMELELFLREREYRTLVESLPDFVVRYDLDLRRTYVNPAWEKASGLSAAEVINIPHADISKVPVPTVNEYIEKIRLVLETGATQTIEFTWINANGVKLFLDYVIVPEYDRYGKITGVLSVGRDVTDRKQAEADLLKSEKRYRSMMEAFAEPLYICSPDFIVEYMNPAMIRHIGKDATGEKCHKTLHGLDYRCDWCVFDKIINGETVESKIKSPLDDRDYHVTNMPIQNKDGTVSKMTIYRDITDYLQAVSEKEKAQAQLVQSQKMESIGNLAGGIAHDFNNILSAIIGFTELAIEDAPKGTSLEDSLQEIYSAGKRARDLVKQILAFARQSDEKTIPIQPSMIVKEILRLIRSTIPTNIKIQQEMESDSLIMGNATQVHQVLMNLCTNAAQAMEDSGGVLKVCLKDVFIDKKNSLNRIGMQQRDYIEIRVSDTGVGIAPEIIGSIFDPYFTTKGPGEGTGMGLAMAHGIVEKYGGMITVDSRLGIGTTFAIYLPVTGKRTDLRADVSVQLPKGTEHILFVDDEFSIAKMGSRIIKRLGYLVTTRTSSIEALELFRVKPDVFDLVITDMTMPNLTGDKFAVELMKIRPDIPVILCTGYSKKISDETALEIGIKAFAYKPIVKADLAKTVRKVLDDAKNA